LPGTEARIGRIGDEVILEPIEQGAPFDAKALWAKIDALGDEPFMAEGREQPEMRLDRTAFEE